MITIIEPANLSYVYDRLISMDLSRYVGISDVAELPNSEDVETLYEVFTENDIEEECESCAETGTNYGCSICSGSGSVELNIEFDIVDIYLTWLMYSNINREEFMEVPLEIQSDYDLKQELLVELVKIAKVVYAVRDELGRD